MEVRVEKATFFMKFFGQDPRIDHKTVRKTQNIEIVPTLLEWLDLDACSTKIGFFKSSLAIPAKGIGHISRMPMGVFSHGSIPPVCLADFNTGKKNVTPGFWAGDQVSVCS
jgi:hypothetical protein